MEGEGREGERREKGREGRVGEVEEHVKGIEERNVKEDIPNKGRNRNKLRIIDM